MSVRCGRYHRSLTLWRAKKCVDNQGHSLGYKAFLNGALASNILIDATKVATDRIDYVATDTSGNPPTRAIFA